MEENKRIEFSDDIKDILKENFPDKDIYSMSLEELKLFKEEILELRQQYSLLETGAKLCGNAAYGASANKNFYFYNVNLAADITGECRLLTKTMWHNIEEFFHNTLWERKDLWEKFDFALDPSKKDWYSTQPVSIYRDTDSTIGSSVIKLENEEDTIENIWNKCFKETGLFTQTENGQELVEGNGRKVLNYVNGKLKYVPIKYIMRHKVSKPKFKITTKSGKEIVVTGDHSCIVVRNGKQLVIKAKDINKETDKIITVKLCDEFKQFMNYIVEDIQSIEQLDDFDNEYVYDIEVDDDSHTFIANDILIHNSVYSTYGSLFECFTPEYKEKYNTERKKVEWILKFNKEFFDNQNTQWCEELYSPRHVENKHVFERETVNYAQLV